MVSILVGNGINIQFSGKTYTSDFIIKRAYLNSIHEKYSELFEGQITGKELSSIIKWFVSIANDIISGKYDIVDDPDLQDGIREFKSRYIERVKKYDKFYHLLDSLSIEETSIENVEEELRCLSNFEQKRLFDIAYNRIIDSRKKND